MSKILPAGTPAPDFTLHVTPDQTLSLKELRGRPVILAFYPADWSPVCGDQMALYNEVLPEFHRFNAELLGISVDGVWCHAAFSRDRKLHFPLLLTSNRKALWRSFTERSATETDSPSARSLSSIRTGPLDGAMSPR